MPTALREYLTYSQNLRDIESSTLSPEFGKMETEDLSSLLSKAIDVFSKCRSKESQTTFDRIENRIRARLREIPNPTSSPSTDISNNENDWYKKPLGIIALTVIGGVLTIAAIWVLNHNLNLGF